MITRITVSNIYHALQKKESLEFIQERIDKLPKAHKTGRTTLRGNVNSHLFDIEIDIATLEDIIKVNITELNFELLKFNEQAKKQLTHF